jgi:hypothetical protein
MEEERDFYEDIKINKFALDKDWETHQEKSYYWAKQAAAAKKEVETKNLQRKVRKAALYKKHRILLEATKDKVSEAMIEANVRTDPEYQKISEELIDAQEYYDILDAAKWEFVNRKMALEKIQEGLINGLFGGPKDAGERKRDSDQVRERIQSGRS